jgi:hypothetical protein
MNYFKILGALFAFSLLCVAVPIFLVEPGVGKALILSLPPMLLVTLSWMIPVLYVKMSNWNIVALTIGVIPARIGIVCAYAYWCKSLGVDMLALIVGMMWHWMIFSVPELMLLYKQGCKKYAGCK